MEKRARNTLLLLFFGWLFATAAVSAQSGILERLGCRYVEEIFTKVSDPLQATRDFYAALEELTAVNDLNRDRLARARADAEDLFTDRDREQYRNLPSQTARARFLLYFWRREDVTPATEVNERLVEHYRRLAYARKAFSALTRTGYDDRGKIYVRYGPPDERVVNPDLSFSDPIETWAYYKFGDPVTFDFIDRGDGYRLATRFDEGVKAADEYSRWVAIGDLLRLRSHLSTSWFALLSEWESMSNEPVSQRRKLLLMDQAINEHTERVTTAQKKLPVAASDIFKDYKPLPVAARVAWFRDRPRQHALVLYFTTDRQNLQGTENGWLRCKAAVKWPDHRIINAIVDSVAFTPAADDRWPEVSGAWQFLVGPGRYLFALEVENPAGKQSASKTFIAETGSPDDVTLQLSTLLLARRIEPLSAAPLDAAAGFVRNDLHIEPVALDRIPRNRPVFLYFEIYNLQTSAAGEGYYEVEYTLQRRNGGGVGGFFRRINPFGGAKDRISLMEKRRPTAPRDQVYFLLDLHNLRPGDYRLTVRVKDLYAGIERLREMSFTLE